MKNLLTACFSIAITYSCLGQGKLDKDTSGFNKKPLIVINSSKSIQQETYNISMEANDISSIEVLKNSKNGVILITLKPDIEMLTINQLFDKYNIAKRKRILPIFIDSAIMYKPEMALFQLKTIKNILIQKEKETKLKYINIISVRPLIKPKPGEMYIRGLAILN